MATANPGNQATTASISSLPEMTDLVRRTWSESKILIPRAASVFFREENIGAGNGSSKLLNEFDVSKFAQNKPEGTNSRKGKFGKGYEVTMNARTFSLQVEVTLEMRNDQRYSEIGALITNMSGFCENREEIDMQHRFTFCSSTTYTDMGGEVVDVTVGDGLQLAYSAHTLAFNSGVTYKNRLTGDPAFSVGAFEVAKTVGATETLNNFGDLDTTAQFTHIATGSDQGTIRAVQQFLKSIADPEAVQSGVVNIYKNGYTHVILDHLATTAAGAYDSTKRRWWFLIAAGMNGWDARIGRWISPTLVTPTSGGYGEDPNNYNWIYSCYTRYGIAVLSGRKFIASLPTS
jgi:hypothetical protein